MAMIAQSVGKERMQELSGIGQEVINAISDDQRIKSALEIVAIIALIHTCLLEETLEEFLEKSGAEALLTMISYKETKQ